MKILPFPQQKALTKVELLLIEKRVDEIDEILDLCTDQDNDVLENLEKELDQLMGRLETSLKIAQAREAAE